MNDEQESELPAALGEVIGSYRLDGVIGRGGMGCVYSGVHVLLGRRAAVKILWPQFANDNEQVARFLQEARIVNDIRHPNIVEIADLVATESPKRIACVMEHLAGVPLRALVDKPRLTPRQALNLAMQIVDALGAVHTLGVVHRDLKPDNVMILASADAHYARQPSLKILDFGIAKVTTSRAALKTATGWSLGTAAYMAPEQVFGDPVSPATDVYAIGEIVFEMILGRRLFEGASNDVLRAKARNLVPAIELPSDFPDRDSVAEAVARCVRSEPAARPSLVELMRVFTAALATLGAPSPITARRPVGGAVPEASALADVSRAQGDITLSQPIEAHPLAPPLASGALRVARPRGARLISISMIVMGAITALAVGAVAFNELGAPTTVAPSSFGMDAEPIAGAVAGGLDAGEPSAVVEEAANDAAVLDAESRDAAIAPKGALTIRVLDSTGNLVHARVLVDGRDIGRTTPVERYEVSAGRHRVEIRGENVRERRDVTVVPNQRVQVLVLAD